MAASVISRLAGENQALWSRADCLDVTVVEAPRCPVEIEPAPSPTVDVIRPRDHRPHAPNPIGRIAPADDRVPPPEDVPRVAGYFHVTNLGSLLDVLA